MLSDLHGAFQRDGWAFFLGGASEKDYRSMERHVIVRNPL